MTVFVLLIDDATLDPRECVSAFRTLESAKAAAELDHREKRVAHALPPFELSWTRDDHYSLADDVSLSIDYFVLTLEVGT